MATLPWFVIACLAALSAIFLLQDRPLYMPANAGVERMASGGLRAWASVQDFRPSKTVSFPRVSASRCTTR